MSIFSCVYWPSVCLLWRNVCLGLLTIFWLVICFFVIVEAVYIFWKLSLCWLHHLQISSLSWKFVFFILFMGSFAVWKLICLVDLICLFLLLFLLPWETDLWKHGCDLCQNVLHMYCSWSFMVSCLTFKVLAILNFFLSMLRGWFTCCSPTFLISLAERLFFPIVYCLLCQRLIVLSSVGLFLGSVLFHWSIQGAL